MAKTGTTNSFKSAPSALIYEPVLEKTNNLGSDQV